MKKYEKPKYSKAQKNIFYKSLIKKWKAAKEFLLANNSINELVNKTSDLLGYSISTVNFALVLKQMQNQGLTGLPYIDAKTYGKWQEEGYQVIKGSKSTLDGITWISINNKSKDNDNKEEVENEYLMPKVFKLFHRSQVKLN